MDTESPPVEFLNLYNIPGEGLVAEFRERGQTMLFDLKGLQYRIVQRKQHGESTRAEEEALARMKSLGQSVYQPW